MTKRISRAAQTYMRRSQDVFPDAPCRAVNRSPEETVAEIVAHSLMRAHPVRGAKFARAYLKSGVLPSGMCLEWLTHVMRTSDAADLLLVIIDPKRGLQKLLRNWYAQIWRSPASTGLAAPQAKVPDDRSDGGCGRN